MATASRRILVNGFREARSEARRAKVGGQARRAESGGGVLGKGQPTPSTPARGSEGALL